MTIDGIAPPWDKDRNWAPEEKAEKERSKLPKGRLPDYCKLAAIYMNVLAQQADLIRMKQLETKKLRGKNVPEHLKVTREELDFVREVHKEILESRAFISKIEKKAAPKPEPKKKEPNPFVDPRAAGGEELPEVEGKWAEDGREGA